MIFVDSRSICHGDDIAAFWPSLDMVFIDLFRVTYVIQEQ